MSDEVKSAAEVKPLESSQLNVLIIEDDPGDAALISELIQDAFSSDRIEITEARSLAEGLRALNNEPKELVLLDLKLPDGYGVDCVKRIRRVAEDTPIIVLTGLEETQLGLTCVSYGAQDFLSKDDLDEITLRRAAGYAISRVREARIRELEETLERYRILSSKGAVSATTASLAGSGPVSRRWPEQFKKLCRAYQSLVEAYQMQSDGRPPPGLRAAMEGLTTRLGDLGGGPRDLIDLHIRSLQVLLGGRSLGSRGRLTVAEGRLLALEMMGLLVDFYRVGYRRRFDEESDT